jgi:hypothetical protein
VVPSCWQRGGPILVASDRFGDRVVATSSLDVLVLADGEPFSPDASAEDLLAGERSWLESFFVVAIELKRSAFRRVTEAVRERLLDTLRRMKVVPATTISLQVGPDQFPPPHAMRSAVPVIDSDHPSVLVIGMSNDLSWAQLEGALPAVSDLLGFSELTDSLRLAIKYFAAASEDDRVSPQSAREIAAALDETEERVLEVLRELRGAAQSLLDFLGPVLVVYLGIATYDELIQGVPEIISEQDILKLLSDLSLPIPLQDLLDHGRVAGGVDELRRALGIQLDEFNDALRAMGRAPIHYSEEHGQLFATFIGENKDRFLVRLRSMFFDDYRQGLPLTTYVQYRDELSSLRPKTEWLDIHEFPPEEVMETAVGEWLAGARPGYSGSDAPLDPLEQVQRENRQTLRLAVSDARRRVLAWTERQGSSAPPGWEQSEVEQAVWDRLLASGIADFEPLGEDVFLSHLEIQGLWPSGMPLTFNLSELGLSAADLEAARTEEERQQARREFEKRSIEIDGQRYRATPENFGKLAEVVRNSLSESFLKKRPRFAALNKVAPSGERTRTSVRSKAGSTAVRSMTEPQRAAIGLIGEVVALEWLKGQYPSATEDSWKSTYRDFILGGSQGDDSLGYDFEVPVGRTSYFFEVKATIGESPEIELGESQVVTARNQRRSERYRILFVPHVLDAERRTVHVLPNPFSDRGQESYRLMGSGLRYWFLLRA